MSEVEMNQNVVLYNVKFADATCGQVASTIAAGVVYGTSIVAIAAVGGTVLAELGTRVVGYGKRKWKEHKEKKAQKKAESEKNKTVVE